MKEENIKGVIWTVVEQGILLIRNNKKLKEL
jgi:hypothetical protein